MHLLLPLLLFSSIHQVLSVEVSSPSGLGLVQRELKSSLIEPGLIIEAVVKGTEFGSDRCIIMNGLGKGIGPGELDAQMMNVDTENIMEMEEITKTAWCLRYCENWDSISLISLYLLSYFLYPVTVLCQET